MDLPGSFEEGKRCEIVVSESESGWEKGNMEGGSGNVLSINLGRRPCI